MDALARECLNRSDLKKALGALRGDRNQLYYDCLDRMKTTLTSYQFDYVSKLFLWVAWARRPLSEEELAHALAIEFGMDDIGEEDLSPVSWIIDWSVGLLFIDTERLVRFIHPTTSEFFVARRQQLYPGGDSKLANACLDYLSLNNLKQRLPDDKQRSRFFLRLKAYPFLRYAVLHGLDHLTDHHDQHDITRGTDFLMSNTRQSFVQALYCLDRSWNINEDVPPLHIVALLGHTRLLVALIKESTTTEINSRDDSGTTPLIYAASRGDEASSDVEALLQAGADASMVCRRGMTALNNAVRLNAKAVVNCLSELPNIGINFVPRNVLDALPALHEATRLTDTDILHVLLSRDDVNVNLRDARGCTALYMAAILENDDAMKCLLDHRDICMDLGSADQSIPALHAAALYGNVDCAKLLLDRGADIDALDGFEANSLMRGVDGNTEAIVELLIRYGVNTTHRDKLGRTALHSAARRRSWQCMSYLLDHVDGIHIDSQGGSGETPLHDACGHHDTEGAKLLVSRGARCDIEDHFGRTVVDLAMMHSRNFLLGILQRGVGFSPRQNVVANCSIVAAVESCSTEEFKQRLSNATLEEINARTVLEGTALHKACERGRSDCLRLLLEHGAVAELKDGFNRTPISVAVERGHLGCVKALIAHGVDIEQSREPERVLWEYCWLQGNWNLVIPIIESGATLDSESYYVLEVLQYAVTRDKVKVVRRILEAGVSKHIKLMGYTLTEIAEITQATEVLGFLTENAGKAE